MKWRPKLLNCGYVSGTAASVAGQFSFVSLYNNDNLGRYLAVLDVGMSIIITTARGYQVQNKQVGSGAVNPSPLVTNQAIQGGQLTTGSVAALPTFSLINGLIEPGNLWPHDFPLIVLAPGWSISLFHPTAAQALTASYLFEAIDASDLQQIEAPPRLVIPKVITLTVESD